MDNLSIVVFLMVILISLSAFTDKFKLPYPVLMVGAGLAIGFLPFLLDLQLDPDIVFLIFLPPLLYNAAFNTSWLDFKKEIGTISTLAITLVFFTTVIVAVAAYYLIPVFTWPLAFTLGAIISPPDAVAASNVIKGLGLNKKVITILEGESLVNDASALIAYRYAVSAVLTGSFFIWQASLQFILVAAGGVGVGLVVGYLMVRVHRRIIDHSLVETSLSLLTPFVAYLLAEKFHVSGILSVVTAGILIAWHSREIFPFQTRLLTTGVWNTLMFLLNGIVFILMGMQLPGMVKGLQTTTVYNLVGYGVLISAVTMVIRIVWVFAGAYHQHLTRKKRATLDRNEEMEWKNVLVVAWTGTRGVVSLAAALALPLSLRTGEPFPKRHSIVLLTFSVIFITLVVQSLTLPLLIRWLKIKPVTEAQQKEEDKLALILTESGLGFINNVLASELDEITLERIAQQFEFNQQLLFNRRRHVLPPQQIQAQLHAVTSFLNAQLQVIAFQRSLLLKFQTEGRFGEEALSKAERELDIEELRLNALLQKAGASANAASGNSKA